MLSCNLLQEIICILTLLSALGGCAVIPQKDSNSLDTEDSELAHKWDTISRLKSKVGPTDSTTRDRILNEFGKVPKSSEKWGSVVDGRPQQLADLAKSRVDRDSLRSGTEFDLTRSTRPLAVKSTAGHVGYEERHRFSGIPFDQLIHAKDTFAEPESNGSGGTFEDEAEEADSDEEGAFSSDSEDENADESMEPLEDLVAKENDAIEKEPGIPWVVSSQKLSDSSSHDHQKQRTSSRRKEARPVSGKNTGRQIHWKASSQSKVAGASAQAPEQDVEFKVLSKAEASLVDQDSESLLRWKAAMRQSANNSTGLNPHDRRLAKNRGFVVKAQKSGARQRREAGPIDTATTSHRESKQN